ncbi:putative membrane protein [Synechococcus sp. BIOS-U3-1]|nr:putative membrane protein [Synechococcus sp. BIOS-U3-1]
MISENSWFVLSVLIPLTANAAVPVLSSQFTANAKGPFGEYE